MLKENLNNPQSNSLLEKGKANFKVILLFSALIFVIASASASIIIAKNKIDISGIAGNPEKAQNLNNSSKTALGDSWEFSLAKSAFAAFGESFSRIQPKLNDSKVDLEQADNYSAFLDKGIEFSQGQKDFLNAYGFTLARNNITGDQSGFNNQDDFVDLYDDFNGNPSYYFRDQSDAIFITSDLALHLFHILIDRGFQQIEETKFQPLLKEMSKELFLDSINKYNTAGNSELKNSYKRLAAFYLIPLTILDAGSDTAGSNLKPEDFPTFAQYMEALDQEAVKNSRAEFIFTLDQKNYAGANIADEIYETAKTELELIQNAKGMAASPLFTPLRPEFLNDYSQFKPRSHYTKNNILKSYFIAMMWYGRMGFTLNSPDLTRDALLITGQINNLKSENMQISRAWSDMTAVIDFFVGEVDDLSAYQYTDIIKKVYGKKVNEGQFVNHDLLEKFKQTAIEDLLGPKILSEIIMMEDYDSQTKEELLAGTMQFRFFGQRFTPDAYIINKLTQGDEAPDPETGQKLPTMPTALMPMRVIAPDNQILKNYLDEWINDPERIAKQNRESDKIIEKTINELELEFAGYPEETWTQNIYWSWLDCYRPLLAEYSGGYPWFMQNEYWQRKNLGTVLGSYAELKHDTLLYAKQSYAELGAGGDTPDEIPPVVKGYVEPDLEFWNRILALAQKTQSGLKDRDVFPEEFESKFESFAEAARFFRGIAEKELKNQAITDDEFEKLRTITSVLSRIVSPLPGRELTDKEKRAGIIADIHTDAINQQILYQATGKPYILYVLVKDVNGARLTRGAVFSHYEFAGSLDERLSDEDWQAQVYAGAGELPASDKWTRELIK